MNTETIFDIPTDDEHNVEPEWFIEVARLAAENDKLIIPADLELAEKITQQGSNLYFLLTKLRKAFLPTDGENERTDRRVSFTTYVWTKLGEVVPTGPGAYGTPVVELALRLFIAVLQNDSNDIHTIANTLKSVTDAGNFAKGVLELYIALAPITKDDE